MAAINSTVLACNYAISGLACSQLNGKLTSVSSSLHNKFPLIKAEAIIPTKAKQDSQGRRVSLLLLATTLFTSAASPSNSNAGIIEDYLEKTKANKELNDKKRLATSGANFARAFTVEFGSCKFPENFTGCQDLAKQKKVPFLSEDLELECEGKDKYKCGSNVFWKW